MKQHNQKKIELLWVDDHQFLYDTMLPRLTDRNEAILEGKEHGTLITMNWVNSGESCLEHIKEKPADFILLDIALDKMDGIETAEKIKEYCQQSSLEVPYMAFFTALANEHRVQSRANVLELPIIDKKTGILQLINRIEYILRGSRPSLSGLDRARLRRFLVGNFSSLEIDILDRTRRGETADTIYNELEKREGKLSIYKVSDTKKKFKKLLSSYTTEDINSELIASLMEYAQLGTPLNELFPKISTLPSPESP